MEVNPRIQVEHPITEAITGIDIVEQQIRIAQGEALPFSQEDIHFNGYAIEVRVNAEDPQKDFQPTPTAFYFYRETINQSCIKGVSSAAPNKTSLDETLTKSYMNISVLVKDGTTGKLSIGKANITGTMDKGSNVIIEPWQGIIKGNAYNPSDATFNSDSDELVLLNNYVSCETLVNKMNESIQTVIDEYNANVDSGSGITAPPVETGDGTGGTDTTSCAVEGIGWLVCPIVNFLGKVIDSSWGFLTNFLKVDSKIIESGDSSPTYQAWQMVRNIANVAFAIVFLIIIFSQITSFGISNYGIKKMLPKLIIAAILVNLSFYLCQIAVDISNILGYSIKNIFDGVTKGLPALSALNKDLSALDTETPFGDLVTNAITVVGGGAIIYAQIGVLIPVLLGGIVAVLMVLFMLIGRQALIILLVVLSPLAFVAYLLPNTSKLFDKWKKLFMSLLLLFPIVALVVGASSLASGILTNVFTSSDNTIGQIAAAAVAILPLFVVPGMLKKSLDGVGNIGGALNKLSDKWGKGAGSKWTGSKLNKHIEAERANKSARIQGGVYEGGKYGKYNPNVWRSKLHGKYNQSNISGKYGDKMSAMGVSQADKFNDENVGLATSRLNSLGLDKARIESIALGDDKEFGSNLAMRQAAIKDMVATNNVGGINKLWDKTIDMDDSQNSKYIRNAFANSLMSSSSRPAYLGGGAVGAMRIHDKSAANGQRTFEGAIRSAIGNNTYSPDKLARADKDEVAELNRVLSLGGLKDDDVVRISKNAKTAISDNKFDVSKNIGEIEKIAELAPAEQVAQPIASSSNGQILVDQNGLPLQSNQPQTFGGSSREPVTTNDNDFVIKDKRIRW
jgi:hypothetical protein